jgi:hypothetical protein
MTTSSIAAIGVTLTRAGYTIAEMVSVSGVKPTLAMLDAFNFGSTGGVGEFIPGKIEPPKITVQCAFIAGDTNGQAALVTDQTNRTLQSFVLTWPTSISKTATFSAYVVDFDPSPGKVGDKIVYSFTLQISGPITWGSTASTGLTALTGTEQHTGSALTFKPGFLANTLKYVTEVDTASTYIILTPTGAGQTISISALGVSQTVVSGAASGQILLDAAGTVTKVYITTTQTGCAPQITEIYVGRP